MELYIPEPVVTEILTRVPAYRLLKLPRVCREWKDLMSTQYFHNARLIRSKEQQRQSLMIIISFPDEDEDEDDDGGLALVDRRVRRLALVKKRDQPVPGLKFPTGIPFLKYELGFSIKNHLLLYSCDGLIVLYKGIDRMKINQYLITNPITGESVTIKCSNSKLEVIASFFNPYVKEYCLLFERGENNFEFEILNLGSQPLSPKALKRPSASQNPSYCPLFYYGTPLVIDNANIYWQLNDMPCKEMIMAFNIKTEEFSFLAHPPVHKADDALARATHANMDIVNIHDNLCFIHNDYDRPNHVVFHIWSLKDPADHQQEEQLAWIKIHRIRINLDKLDAVTKLIAGRCFKAYTVMALENGELFLQHYKGKVYAYNVELGTARMIWVPGKIRPEISRYVPSFVSLTNYESEIWI